MARLLFALSLVLVPSGELLAQVAATLSATSGPSVSPSPVLVDEDATATITVQATPPTTFGEQNLVSGTESLQYTYVWKRDDEELATHGPTSSNTDSHTFSTDEAEEYDVTCDVSVSGTATYREADGTDHSLTVSASENFSTSLVVAEIQIQGKRCGTSSWVDGPQIAAGGVDNDVHKADIQITVAPVGAAGLPSLSVDLTGGGGGHLPTEWWWPTSYHKKASLSFGDDGTFTHGDTTPISLDVSSEGIFDGTLLSSNKVETSTVRVQVGEIEQSIDISFVAPSLSLTVADPQDLDTWYNVACTLSLSGVPVPGHDLTFGARDVTDSDGTDQASLGESEAESCTLETCIWLDSSDHKYATGTTDSANGQASTRYQLRAYIDSFTLGVADLSVTE